MQATRASHALFRRLAAPLRTLSHQSQAVRTTPSPHLYHRQNPRWRPRAAATSSTNSSRATSETTSSSNASLYSDPRNRLLLSYHDLERALEKRGLKSVRALLAGIGITSIAVALAWPRIKQWGAAEGAEVAAASLEQQQLQERFSNMVHEVLADPRTGEQVEQLLKAAVISLFQDEYFNAKAVEWTAKVFGEALMWDSVREKGTDYVQSVLADDSSKESAYSYLSQAISDVVADTDIQDAVATSIWSGVRASVIGRRKTVTEKVESSPVNVKTDKRPVDVATSNKVEPSTAESIPIQAASLANGDHENDTNVQKTSLPKDNSNT